SQVGFHSPSPHRLLRRRRRLASLRPPRSSSAFHHAEADPRDQGLPPDGEEEGRAVGPDQEDQGRRQVQGAVLQVPLHPLRLRRRQGQQAQAVAPARFDCPGGLSTKTQTMLFVAAGMFAPLRFSSQ
uniref:Uncharacterized protein n=1 Tax=Oryza brachyantha TaxID=4533 RepID=J3N7Y6_ORYBR